MSALPRPREVAEPDEHPARLSSVSLAATAVLALAAPGRDTSVDARWAPVLAATLSAGLLGPGLSAQAALLVSALCVLLGTAALLGVVALGRRDGRRVRGPVSRGRGPGTARRVASVSLAMIALSLLCAGLVLISVAQERARDELTGWDAVRSGVGSHRIALEVTGEPSTQVSAFGQQRVTVSVQAHAHGHPLQPLEHRPHGHLSGDESWAGLTPGDRVCTVVTGEASGSTVFLRAQTAPQRGRCAGIDAFSGELSTESAASEPRATPTGRDRLRAAFQEVAAFGVGASPELIPGLVLGDRTAQSAHVDDAMKVSGLSHLSAVSGANCALIATAVTLALRAARQRRAVVTAAVLASLLLFVLIVGPEPSVLRAAVMGGLGVLALFTGRGRSLFSLLCVAATLLILIHPPLAREPALHLSLAATTGILLAARPAEALLYGGLGRVLPAWGARWLSVSLAVTVSAQLACQPVLILMTGTVSSYAILANLLAAPLVAPITVLGTLAATLVLVAPAVSTVLVFLIQWPSAGIGWIATTTSQLPGALRDWPHAPVGPVLWWVTTLATVLAILVLMAHERTTTARVHRVGRTAAPARHPATRGRRSVTALITAALAAAVGGYAAVFVDPPAAALPEQWSVAFCDVGQGDMTVLRSAPHSAVVVDVGPDPDLARRCLDDLGVTRVEAVLLTHLHQDHTGGLSGLNGDLAPQAVHYATADSTLTTQAPPAGAHRLATGEQGQTGALRWSVLWANHQAVSENDASAQILADVETPAGSVTVLLTGDMEAEASRTWVAGRAPDALPVPEGVDVLHVAHHGARNGGADLPRAVRARLHVISVGADNPFGHPHATTLATLDTLGPVARTDQAGTILIVPDQHQGFTTSTR
ncbi:MAG: ComEC/Rec2 family competence protein [Micrococcus sp.]|nr:ComEC/Rec2 family competence protein [Micrococcus sp.]